MSQNFLSRHAARIFDRPLLIAARPLEAYMNVLAGRIGLPSGVQFIRPEVRGADLAGYTPTEAKPIESKTYSVAVIRVMGPIVQHAGIIDADCSEFASYEAISEQIRAALADPNVSGILLHIDSPGGEVAGAFDCAALISQASKVKPVVALAEDMALSAGYLLASAADEIVATQTGYVGSIGVITTHVDFSGALKKEGIVVTHIHAGDRKADGSPYFPLSKEARSDLEGFIARDYGLFVAHVAGHRPMTEADVRSTQAAVFTAQDGVGNGLADHIGTRETALQRLAALIGARESKRPGASAVSSVPMVGAANTPAPGGNQEVAMSDTKKGPEAGAAGGGNVVSMEERLKAAEARAAKAEALAEANAATVASLKAGAKTKLIEAATAAGKVVPANLAAVTKLADHMEEDELATYLEGLPSQVKPRASGIPDSKPKPSQALATIAARIGMKPEQVEAYDNVEAVHLDGTVTLKDGSRVLASEINAGRA